MIQIHALPTFQDNYIWVLVDDASKQAIAVDPGDGATCVAWLERRGLQLVAVLITHHHQDHVGGLEDCRRAYPQMQVYGPAYTQQEDLRAAYDVALHDAEDCRCQLGQHELVFKVLYTPGHTLDHICYLGCDWLFCGDTLFAGGCGRMFEGQPAQMYASLQRLAQLPSKTQVYCAHEYTLANLTFARLVDPDNSALQARYAEVKQLQARGACSLPSQIGLECATNPFLRCDTPAVAAAVAQHLAGESGADSHAVAEASTIDPVAVFAGLRAWKDMF